MTGNLNHLMTGGNERSYVLNKSAAFRYRFVLLIYDLLLPTDIKGLLFYA